MYVCMYVCMYVWMYVCMYVSIHTIQINLWLAAPKGTTPINKISATD